MVLSSPPGAITAGGGGKKRWSSLLPLFVAFVVVAEIAFLGRLDMAKNAAQVQHWTTSFYFPSSPSSPEGSAVVDEGDANCRDWLEREDAVTYKRDFRTDPVLVSGADKLPLSVRVQSVMRPIFMGIFMGSSMNHLHEPKQR